MVRQDLQGLTFGNAVDVWIAVQEWIAIVVQIAILIDDASQVQFDFVRALNVGIIRHDFRARISFTVRNRWNVASQMAGNTRFHSQYLFGMVTTGRVGCPVDC